ncbi:MAG: D-TA family PLP-dependent enzyme, partial [Chthoniobacteraceae bacterium]
NLGDYTTVLQNEEHFAIETPTAGDWKIGDVIYAVPTHVCPTVALHSEAVVVENGRVVAQWPILARARKLTA